MTQQTNDVAQRLMTFIESDGVLWDAVYEIRHLQAMCDHWKHMYEIVAARLYKIENGWSVHVCDNPEAVRGE